MAKTAREICDHVAYLKNLSATIWQDRERVRLIMNGGRAGMAALVGSKKDIDQHLPAANLMLSGITRMGQQLQRPPSVQVDPPNDTDNERARRRAEKRERIVTYYDETCQVELLQPQAGRWIVGYGFVPFVVTERLDADGYAYPHLELRDPADAFPAEWGPNQQPEAIAFIRRIPVDRVKRMYPHAATELAVKLDRGAVGGMNQSTGGWPQTGQWENGSAAGRGIEVAEYYDQDGMTLTCHELDVVLDHIPNVLTRPQFYVAKRYAFDALTGQFDHVIGLMAAMAKLNLLALIATEQNVFAETVVEGELNGPWKRGMNKVNIVPPGTRVSKLQSNLPYQMFQEIDRLERQLRLTAGYPVQVDAESPNSFVTGRGLQELGQSNATEIREYQTVFRHAYQNLDAIRLEHDEMSSGDIVKMMAGMRKGAPYAETYTPSKDIRGSYRTRRMYSLFPNAWDDPQEVVQSLQLAQGGIVSNMTIRENIAGLPNAVKEEDRIRAERAEAAVLGGLLQRASTPDAPDAPKAIMAAIELLPEGTLKDAMRKFYTPEEPEMTPEEMMMAQGGMPGMEMGPPPGPPPGVSTVLSQLSQSGQVEGGVQTVGRLPER